MMASLRFGERPSHKTVLRMKTGLFWLRLLDDNHLLCCGILAGIKPVVQNAH